MANLTDTPLDSLFQTLADPTRRAVVARLGQGPAAVSELAEPHDMALPSFLKHIRQLERCGLVSSQKHGRQRVCKLHPEAMIAATQWLEEQRQIWESRFDRMDTIALAVAKTSNLHEPKD